MSDLRQLLEYDKYSEFIVGAVAITVDVVHLENSVSDESDITTSELP